MEKIKNFNDFKPINEENHSEIGDLDTFKKSLDDALLMPTFEECTEEFQKIKKKYNNVIPEEYKSVWNEALRNWYTKWRKD